MSDTQKVFFVQEVNGGEYETEPIWCQIDGNDFIIDNIPFVAKRISLGDVIKAEFDEQDERYYFEDFVSTSGNTTVRIFFYDDLLIESTRKWLYDSGCESEVLPARSIVAVNIPKLVSYTPIKEFLEMGEQQEKWVYEESCLAHDYD